MKSRSDLIKEAIRKCAAIHLECMRNGSPSSVMALGGNTLDRISSIPTLKEDLSNWQEVLSHYEYAFSTMRNCGGWGNASADGAEYIKRQIAMIDGATEISG